VYNSSIDAAGIEGDPNMVQKIVAALVCASLLGACDRTAPAPATTELDALLDAAVAANRTPGLVAMVATAEGILYEHAVGVPADTIFAIASMTKPVTSVAVMQLVETGKVDLDEPAHTYVPELAAIQVLEGGVLRPTKSPPTVRHLLTHTSGFAYEIFNRDIADLVQSGKLPTLFTWTDDFLAAPLVFDPGARFEYGISVDWLGRIVESVSGQSLEAYMRTSIFEPLRMNDTFFNVPADKLQRVSTLVARQTDGTLGLVPNTPVTVEFFSGGGGLYSTASDYSRFMRALLAGGTLDGSRILQAETVALMSQNQLGDLPLSPITPLDPQVANPDLVMPGGLDAFGLGFALNRAPLGSGRGAGTLSWAGLYNTYFWIDRENGISAVLLTQMLPFGDPAATKLVDDFDSAVYRVYRGEP
jgi:CubicO group peptidase (beta-lactamase class C family)